MNLAVKRLTAQFLDWIIYSYLISGLPGIFLLVILQSMHNAISNDILFKSLVFLCVLTFPLTYFYLNYRHIKKGQTYGYKIMKIKLVYNDGVNVSKSALIRVILRPFLGIMLIFIPIGLAYGYTLFNSKGEKDLLDSVLGTKAVEV